MKSSTRYSPQRRERTVRLVVEHQGEHDSQWAAIVSVSAKIGCSAQTLRKWIRGAEVDEGVRRAAPQCGHPAERHSAASASSTCLRKAHTRALEKMESRKSLWDSGDRLWRFSRHHETKPPGELLCKLFGGHQPPNII